MRLAAFALLVAASLCAAVAHADEAAPEAPAETLTIVTTTSTEHSGLMGVLLPAYKARSGVTVRALVAGTGKALRIAEAGDADILIAHDPEGEQALFDSGATSIFKPLMYNDFVIVGPGDDPAGIASAPTAVEAFRRIAATGALFASRGDDSGTHRRERAIWAAAQVQPGDWLRETGSGQGPTLNFAAASEAYALTDRGTWLFFGNRGDLRILFAGDPVLVNNYGISLVNPLRHPHVKERAARALIDWMTGPEGQALIAGRRIGGEQAFYPATPAATD